MALRNVVVEGDEILRKKCREVGEITDRIKLTLEDMLETMREEMGVGIAAPQVGVMRRMFIAEPEPERVYFMINPVMLEQSGCQADDEGCLSVPGMVGTVAKFISAIHIGTTSHTSFGPSGANPPGFPTISIAMASFPCLSMILVK